MLDYNLYPTWLGSAIGIHNSIVLYAPIHHEDGGDLASQITAGNSLYSISWLAQTNSHSTRARLFIVKLHYKTEQVVLGCCGSANLSHLFTCHPPRIFGYWRERWVFDGCGVTLTLWFWPPLFLLWCSEATLAIRSERLAEGPYQRNTSPMVRPMHEHNSFYCKGLRVHNSAEEEQTNAWTRRWRDVP